MATGPFYVCTEFGCSLLSENVAVSEPYGVSDLVVSVHRMSKTPKWILTYSNSMVCCVTNKNRTVGDILICFI